MHLVPVNGPVDHARSKAVRCVFGSGLMAPFIAAPATIRFCDIARERGRTMLEKRVERGPLLVEHELRVGRVTGHDRATIMNNGLNRDPPLDYQRPPSCTPTRDTSWASNDRRCPACVLAGTAPRDADRHHRIGQDAPFGGSQPCSVRAATWPASSI